MRRSKNPQPRLGAAIKGRREQLALTQEALAQDAGITVAHLSGIERGHSNPTWATVTAIATALDLTVAGLAKRAEKNTGHLS